MEEHFRIPETKLPIRLLPHQKAILKYQFRRDDQGTLVFRTIGYSTIKKSGKTAIGGAVGRYAAEELDNFGEVFAVANDFSQAQERTFAAIRKSIELDPSYNRKERTLDGVARVTDTSIRFFKSNSVLKPVSLDGPGEAGSNPVASIWSEIWGFQAAKARLLWDEMTPALTRKNSFRFWETYAGVDPDSELLLDLYRLTVEDGRQITAGELADVTGMPLGVFVESPDPDDLVPIWVNDQAMAVTYWDADEDGHGSPRRMPWQKGPLAESYYREEEHSLTPESFNRVHRNLWSGAVSEFVPQEWWAACRDPHIPSIRGNKSRPSSLVQLVLGADAAVSGDCTALVAVSRHPTIPDHIAVRLASVWTPPHNGKLDYGTSLRPEIEKWAFDHNCLMLTYDPYQLHQMSTELRKEGIIRCREFSQGKPRAEADKQLYDVIRDKTIHVEPACWDLISTHMKNAASKQAVQEDTKLRIIKKSERGGKIDLVVALSMAVFECLRLNLDPTGEQLVAMDNR